MKRCEALKSPESLGKLCKRVESLLRSVLEVSQNRSRTLSEAISTKVSKNEGPTIEKLLKFNEEQ